MEVACRNSGFEDAMLPPWSGSTCEDRYTRHAYAAYTVSNSRTTGRKLLGRTEYPRVFGPAATEGHRGLSRGCYGVERGRRWTFEVVMDRGGRASGARPKLISGSSLACAQASARGYCSVAW